MQNVLLHIYLKNCFFFISANFFAALKPKFAITIWRNANDLNVCKNITRKKEKICSFLKRNKF